MTGEKQKSYADDAASVASASTDTSSIGLVKDHKQRSSPKRGGKDDAARQRTKEQSKLLKAQMKIVG